MMSYKLENSDRGKTKNDVAWEYLFDKYHILDEINNKGIYKIPAKAINEKREARLMTKFDHSAQLPKIFQQHKLSIQPDSRSTYVIGRFDSYRKLPKREDLYKKSSVQIKAVEFPEDIQTLDPKNIRSEATALLCAYNAGIISDLLDEQEIRFTIAGRMSTGKFSYSINDLEQKTSYHIDVDNSQCEIDGGFEGADILAIIEAKNSSVDNFLIRQLFYPYKLWINKNTSKQVIPIFLSYFDNIFSFYVYKFEDDENYNSIKLVRQKCYYIGSNDVELQEIINIRETIKVKLESTNIPFPQADVFGRILDMLLEIHSKDQFSQRDIEINYGLVTRQAQYYASAAIYLGFIQREKINTGGVGYSLTKLGSKIIQQTSRERNLDLVKCILEKKVFNKALEVYINQHGKLDRVDIIEIMKFENIQLVRGSQETVSRRADTVRGWINWILRLTQPSQGELPW